MREVTGETNSIFKLSMADMGTIFCSVFAEILFHGFSVTRFFK